MTENFYHGKKGQVVLFVMIVLTISVIIVASLTERSLVGQKNSNINFDSSRAFDAAETGIEELLSRSDLATIANQNGGTTVDTKNVNSQFVSEAKYHVQASDIPGSFGLISKNQLLQVEFNTAVPVVSPINIYFNRSSCVLVSLFDSSNQVNRRVFCGSQVSSGGVSGATVAPDATYDSNLLARGDLNFASVAKLLFVRVINNDSLLYLNATNYTSSVLTINVVAQAWAVTTNKVKKEIQVTTKTTKDIYPVFDYALYLR